MEGEEVDVPVTWRLMKSLFTDMIVEGSEMSTVHQMRTWVRTQRESDVNLVHCAQMIFQTNEMHVPEKECVNVLMGKPHLL